MKMVADLIASNILGFFADILFPGSGNYFRKLGPNIFGDAEPPKMATGAFNLGGDTLAYLHKGEDVIPTDYSTAIRRGEITIGDNRATELMTAAMMNKLDTLIEVSSRNKYAMVSADNITSITKAINKENVKIKEYRY